MHAPRHAHHDPLTWRARYIDPPTVQIVAPADRQLVQAMQRHRVGRAVAVRLVAMFAAYQPWQWPRLSDRRKRAAHWALEASDRLLRVPVGTTWAALSEQRAGAR